MQPDQSIHKVTFPNQSTLCFKASKNQLKLQSRSWSKNQTTYIEKNGAQSLQAKPKK
jgi:hypothetical protein